MLRLAAGVLEGDRPARAPGRRRAGRPTSAWCSLTPAGERLAVGARQLLAEASDLRDSLARIGPDGSQQALTIGVFLDGLGAAMPPLLRAFRATFPELPLRLRRLEPSRLVEALISRQIDVALFHGPVGDERIVVEPLFTEPRVAAVSAYDGRADAAELTANDLLELPARTRRDDIDPAWEGFFTLVPERNDEQPPRVGTPISSFEELLWSISLEGVFLTMPEHLAGTYPGDRFGVAYVPVPDLPPAVFSLAHRRGDDRASVRGFVAVTRATVATR